MKTRIEIVSSSKPTLSSMSKESRDAILTVLLKQYANVRITLIDTLTDLEALRKRRPDLVFLGMKFIPRHQELGVSGPDKIWLSDYLDSHDIPYTGSNRMAHELELNKNLAKQRVLDSGLKTSPFRVVEQNQLPLIKALKLSYPLFVKPANRGGGLGIGSDSVVHTFKELRAKVTSISNNLGSDSLIEEYLPGREFSVAILKDVDSVVFSMMPLELVAPADRHGARLLSEQVKSSNAELVLEVTDKVLKAKICNLALNIFHSLGARDYGRIDIRLDAAGTPHFLEANLIPSLISGYGSFPKACELNSGLGYESMIAQIVNLALQRAPLEADEALGLVPALA